jgi:DNA-binding transcriptional LysR family regulator
MDYRKLRLFQTLAQELNFVRAAARLNISQPGLSQQIKQLEEQLGVQLLLRTSKKVSLTSAGEVFLADVNVLLEKTNQATERARRAASGQTGTLVVGTTSLAMFVLLPELIAIFRRKMKGIDIRFVHMNTSEQEQALIDGSIHVGVLHPPLPILSRNSVELCCVTLRLSRLCCGVEGQLRERLTALFRIAFNQVFFQI